MILTQSGGLMGPIYKLLGIIINFIFETLSSLGIANIGLCIIIFTFVVKILLFPLSIKQQRSMKINQYIQPEINKIQKKYKNKKDQESMMKQNQEIQEVYSKYGTSMTGGCLTTFIQLPIIFALYRVITNIAAYVTPIKNVYKEIIDAIKLNPDAINIINTFVSDHKIKSSITLTANSSTNKIIDVLSQFTTSNWNTFVDKFNSDALVSSYNKLEQYNDFIFGINVGQAPGFKFSIYLLIPVLALLFQVLSIKTMNSNQQTDSDNPAAGMMKTMNIFMPLMSFFMCMTFPAGIGIYWIASSMFATIQQVCVNAYFNKVDIEKMIEKNKEKASKKKKKSFMQRMMDAQNQANDNYNDAKGTGKSISDKATINTKKINYNTNRNNNEVESINDSNSKSTGSLASKANMMLNYKEKDNKKGGN